MRRWAVLNKEKAPLLKRAGITRLHTGPDWNIYLSPLISGALIDRIFPTTFRNNRCQNEITILMVPTMAHGRSSEPEGLTIHCRSGVRLSQDFMGTL